MIKNEKIPSEVFKKLSEEYLSEQKELEISVPSLEKELENLKSTLVNGSNFIKRVKKYTEISELTPELLRIFIEKIEVGDRPKYSRTANQDIKIYYRDIGYLGDYIKETDIEPPVVDFVENKAGELICVSELLLNIVA